MMTRSRPMLIRSISLMLFALAAINLLPLSSQAESRGVSPSFTPTSAAYLPLITAPVETVRFAAVGDYGTGDQGEYEVATAIKQLNADFIITTGDNNYPSGEATTIDAHIGAAYHDFISPYVGSYGPGSTSNRFFPVLGNHDWTASGAAPYLDYFTLPGNERYYEFARGPVDFFALDSDPHEPDGVSPTSAQAAWLQGQLSTSRQCWKLVYMHHPPFSSGQHGSSEWMQWPYQAWGADAVLSGHDHSYERIIVDGFPYFVNGLGGQLEYQFNTPVAGSAVRYNDDLGFMLIDASPTDLTMRFITRGGAVIDTYTIHKECVP